MRRKATEGDQQQPLARVDPSPEALSEAGRRWAELLRRIFEVDPLAFITEPQQIDRIIDHLRRTQTSGGRSSS